MTASTNGWYKCLKGTSFTGYVDLFNKDYCEIAVGNEGEFHYITDTEHLTHLVIHKSAPTALARIP